MTAPAWRARSRFRRLGYAVLPGETFSYLLHLRPREWPIMGAHTALGFILARGLEPVLGGEGVGTLLGALAIWVIFGNGGTLALNSAFDRDSGHIGYLDSPPPPPRHLAAFAVALMAVGQALSLLLPRGFALAYAACLVMSLLYSVPPVRLKAVAGADWIINMLGFGTLTPYAGWAATGIPVTDAGAWVLWAFCPLFAALYPLTQIYQLDEDRARGDRTLATVVGIRVSLVLSVVFVLIAFALLARAALVAHIGPGRATTLALGLIAWLAVLLPWLRAAARLTPAEHQRGMYLALGAWAVTDIVVVMAFAR